MNNMSNAVWIPSHHAVSPNMIGYSTATEFHEDGTHTLHPGVWLGPPPGLTIRRWVLPLLRVSTWITGRLFGLMWGRQSNTAAYRACTEGVQICQSCRGSGREPAE